MRIAVVTAHPDDAELYCGGTILAWRAMGAEVTIVILTDGRRGGAAPGPALAELRRGEAQQGADALGADLVWLGREDGRLAEDPGAGPALRAALADLSPTLVVTHAANDYHGDHRAAARLAADAAGFQAPVLWMDTMMGTGFVPTHYVETTPHQQAKEQALACHASQDPARFIDRARLQARFRVGQCGNDGFAEAFRFDPVYPFADIRALVPAAPALLRVKDRSATATHGPQR